MFIMENHPIIDGNLEKSVQDVLAAHFEKEGALPDMIYVADGITELAAITVVVGAPPQRVVLPIQTHPMFDEGKFGRDEFFFDGNHSPFESCIF